MIILMVVLVRGGQNRLLTPFEVHPWFCTYVVGSIELSV